MKKYIRLPHTTDQSLRAWSAVDEYILRYFAEDTIDLDNILIVHDRFGYLTKKYHPTLSILLIL